MAQHNNEGSWGEDIAANYLAKQGYVILERDWKFGRSKVDLDIICKSPDGRQVVFVEVKTRSTKELTNPEDAVDVAKIRRMGRAADSYVKMRDVVEELRFDIVGIVGVEGGQDIQINHIEDAFNPLLI